MNIFDMRFCSDSAFNTPDVPGYRTALLRALNQTTSLTERDILLRQEAVAITRQITDGIRDLIDHNKKIRNLVYNEGAVPLGTWTQALDTLADKSMPQLKRKIEEMKRDLEHGRVGGFPGTMILYGKPTFTTLEPFYSLVFALAEENNSNTE